MRSVQRFLHTFRSKFLQYGYRGPVKNVMQRTGIDVALDRTYYQLFNYMDRLEERNLDETTQTITIDGTEATFRKQSAREHNFLPDVTSSYENQLFDDLLHELTDGDVFYDIGAHIGLISCIVGLQETDVDIVCFEPHPKTFDSLVRNLELNDVDANAKNYAVSNEDGEIRFDIRRDTAGGMGAVRQSGSGPTVPVKTLDAVVEDENVTPPTIVKSDILGEEGNLVRGAPKVLSSDECRLAYIEVHPAALNRKGSSEDEVRTLLAEYGFDIVELTDEILKATKRTR
ncbi:FkbM family methyltransferase [Halostella sp. PRR32]|uniref:FkbM family methyltransferase n=1 Tax=Halostella sp. PRR32 TaxID=3098147 RepID=UPI002B1E6506|nr:FkbM family methyltransferase [Halostella sp. PRR32]